MVKKIPIRKCVACGERRPKKELIRIVYDRKEESISIDKKGKLPGRGAYICPQNECLNKALKDERLSRALNVSIPEFIYNQLMEEIDIMKD